MGMIHLDYIFQLEIEEEREASGMQSMEMLRDASTTFERSRQSLQSDAQDSFSREHQDSLSRSKYVHTVKSR